MGIKRVPHRPDSPHLAPCNFWLHTKLRGYRYETIEEMKEALTKIIDTLTQKEFHGASRSCWNRTTSALQPEEITSKGTRDSCVYYQYKCPYEKSLETYLMILVYIYIYICVYVCVCVCVCVCVFNMEIYISDCILCSINDNLEKTF